MKKILLSLLSLLSAASFYSCMSYRSVSHSKPGNNDNYTIHYLFEHDGCRIYRFYDMGNYVYFSSPSDNVTAISDDSLRARIQTISLKKILDRNE